MNFNFEFEAPTANMTKGKIVYQYVTYTKTGNFTAKPITVGCATKVGDPFVTKINTFEGFTGMSETSTAVANKTWDKQNTSEKAKKKESFGMSQESVYYNKYEVGTQTVMPCLAFIEFDGKLNSTDDIFATYNFTIGARVYANDSDVSPVSAGKYEYQVTFGEPESDLAAKYEETEVLEDKYAIEELMKEKNKFRLTDFFPNFNGTEKWGW